MRLKDGFITGAVAGVTMLGALALIAPTEVNARRSYDDAVNVRGVEVSVVTLEERRRPTAELTMHNTTDQTVALRGTLKLSEMSLASMGGRMGGRFHDRWEKDCLYVLKAGEKKTIQLRSKKKLRKAVMARFKLDVGDDVLYTARFTPKKDKKKKKKKKKKGEAAIELASAIGIAGPQG